MILFQYLKSNVKFKTDNQVLSGDQAKWTDETTKTKSNYLRMCLFSFTKLEVEQVNLKVVRMVRNGRWRVERGVCVVGGGRGRCHEEWLGG